MTIDQPPEGHLTDEQRGRMRARLTEATGEGAPRGRPWLVPVAAAAAVAVLLAGGAIGGLALMGDGEGSGDPAAGADSTSVAPSVEPTSSEPSHSVEATSSPEPTAGAKGQGSCDDEVASYLQNASKTGEISYDAGTTYLYANADQWVICDTWATVDGGPPTLTGPHAVDPVASRDQFLISQNFSMNPSDGAQFFAAGHRIPGVAKIEYAFPTGDRVEAKIVGPMWSMVYLLPAGPQRAWADPVDVTVTLQDGSQTVYSLTGMDLCAQVNHGC